MELFSLIFSSFVLAFNLVWLVVSGRLYWLSRKARKASDEARWAANAAHVEELRKDYQRRVGRPVSLEEFKTLLEKEHIDYGVLTGQW